MAYVRKTDDIWRQIENKINTLFADRIKHADNWYSYGLDKSEIAQIMIDSLVSPTERALIQELGPRFFKPMNSLTVRIASVTSYKLELPAKQLLPSHWDSYYDADRPTINDQRILDIAAKRSVKVKAVTEEREAMVAQVKAVWNKVPSVNRFVKVWPPGVDLLELSVITKLNEKAEREAVDTVVVDNSALSQLNTTMLRARVAA